MADIVFLAAIGAFFAACVGYVNVCDRIIGGGEVIALDRDLDEPHDDELLERASMTGVIAAIGASLGDNLVALALMVAVVGYLILVLIFPERF